MLGCVNLAILYEDGRGVERDYAQALSLSQRACADGEMLGCNNLGLLHERGHGVDRSLTDAARHFQRACEGELPLGCVNLGVRLLEGRGGVRQNTRRAVSLFRAACEAEEMYGCTRLGLLHPDGTGVRLDDRRARGLFEQACEGGDLRGCNSLGHALQSGMGGPEDPEAGLAAFAIEGAAAAIWSAIENDCKADGVTDMTAKYGARLVERPPVAYLRPVVLHHASAESDSRNKEYMFPMVNVVECPQSAMLDAIGPTLVATAITEDEAWRRELLDCVEIDRLNLGPIPTPQLDWLQPHEGNLIEFLYRSRAVQVVKK